MYKRYKIHVHITVYIPFDNSIHVPEYIIIKVHFYGLEGIRLQSRDTLLRVTLPAFCNIFQVALKFERKIKFSSICSVIVGM